MNKEELDKELNRDLAKLISTVSGGKFNLGDTIEYYFYRHIWNGKFEKRTKEIIELEEEYNCLCVYGKDKCCISANIKETAEIVGVKYAIGRNQGWSDTVYDLLVKTEGYTPTYITYRVGTDKLLFSNTEDTEEQKQKVAELLKFKGITWTKVGE
jgi:hypothetical protein